MADQDFDPQRGLTDAAGAEASVTETVADDDPRLGELRGLADPLPEDEPEQPQFGPLAQQFRGEFDSLIDDQVVEREAQSFDGFTQSKFAEEQEKDPGLADKLGKAFTRGGISLKQQSNTFRANNLLSALSALDEVDKRAAPLDFAGGMRRAKPRGKDAAGAFASYEYMTPEQRGKLRARYQKDLAEQIKAISARQVAIESIPQPPEVVEALQAKTWGEFWTKFKKAPITFISVIGVESLPASAPSIAAGMAGGLIAGPVAAGLAAGSGSFGTDYTSHLISALYSEGVNVRDPEALASAFANKELMDRVGERAKLHAAGVGALDAVSAGIASKVLLPAKALATRPITREIANVGVQLPTQGTLGATGEVAGSLLAGEEIRPGDVGAEFFGEFVGAPAEVAGIRGATAARQTEQPGQTPPPVPPSAPTLEVQRGGEGLAIPVPAAVPNRVVTPDASMEVEATPEVVDLADLTFASGDLQPRDRTRLESDVGVRERAANLDPTRLQPGRVSDAGAPIISADGTIVSGNGRVLSIREAYTDPALKAQADAYRASLGPEAEGMAMPVKVQRLPDMDPADLKKFADLSNRPATAQMSATERAQRDAKAGGADIMGLYTGGSFTSPANREFMRAFSEQVVGSGERGAFSKDGQITKEGDDRMSAAVLAAAYGDSELLSRMLESTDDNIRSVTGALRDASGAFTRLKQSIASGATSAEFDISVPLAETAKRIADLRDRGIKPAAFLAQQDAFADTDPVVEALLRSFYNDDLSRPLSREKLTEVLIRYAEEAEKHAEGGLLPDQTTPQDVLAVAKRGALEDRGEPLFRPSIVGQGAQDGGRGVRGRSDARGGAEPLYGRFQQLLAKGTTADPQAFAQQLGVDEAGLQPLIDQGIEDGLLRVNSRGQVRRTAKVSRATTQPRGASTPETTQPAAAPAPQEPRLPPQSRPLTLAIPADQIIDRRIAQREQHLARPIATVTADYAVRLEDALSTPEHAEILTALRTDKAMTKADVHDLADALGVPVVKSASKEAALQAIEARQATAVTENAEVETFLAGLAGQPSLAVPSSLRVRAFHGTGTPLQGGKFDLARSKDRLGPHFGTEAQAQHFARSATDDPNNLGTVYPVDLNFRKAIEIPDQFTWRGVDTAAAVAEAYPELAGIREAVAKAGDPNTAAGAKAQREAVRTYLLDNGIDGIRYHNPSQTEGIGTSYIALAPGTVERADTAEPLYALGAPALRRSGIPANAVLISSYAKDAEIKADADYRAAKRGDPQAAARLVERLVKPETVAQAAAQFGPDAVYVPVIGEEATGRNKIPELTAHLYAASTAASVSDDIVQSSFAFHTGARPLERLLARPLFDGAVTPGARYVLVDDVSVMGGTLAELANHIISGGGEVVGIVTLVNASRTGEVAPNAQDIASIEARHGDLLRSELGIDPAALTGDEAFYLRGFKDADALRDSIAKARRERDERLRAKGIRAPEAEDPLSALGSRPQPSAKAIRERIAAMVKRGEVVTIPQRVIADVHAAAEPMLAMVPEEVTVTAVARIEPSGIDASVVRLVLQDRDEVEHALLAPWSILEATRAFHLPGRNLIGIVRYLPRSRDTSGQYVNNVAAELGHEIVHALRGSGRLVGANWNRLLSHANGLRLLDGDFATYLTTVGDPYADRAGERTTREVYEEYYSTRADFQEIMDQEAVAHLMEWHLRGLLIPAEIAPVSDLIEEILAGDIGAAAPDYAQQLEEQLAALGAEVQVFTPEVDDRGFFSPSLEAAKQIPQERGTVQQMRAMLLKAGAKPKELEAVGFDKAFPDPQAKVSRGEIEQYLRDNRVQLGEQRLGSRVDDLQFEDVGSGALSVRTASGGPTGLTIVPDGSGYRIGGRRYATLGEAKDDAARNMAVTPTKFESYSTPGGIPGSYREVVTTLPFKKGKDEYVRDLKAFNPRVTEKEIEDAWHLYATGKSVYGLPSEAYSSSHWPGITNPLLHYRVKDFVSGDPPAQVGSSRLLPSNGVETGREISSVPQYGSGEGTQAATGSTRSPETSKVRVLDELQSDWAQRARDQGTRDPANIAVIREQEAASSVAKEQANDALRVAINKWRAYIPDLYREIPREGAEALIRGHSIKGQVGARDIPDAAVAEVKPLLDAYRQAHNTWMDAGNKLKAAKDGVPPAPYISSTSDWVDLGLKQALIDAARDPSVTRFAWAPAPEQIRRYPHLSEHVNQIDYVRRGNSVIVYAYPTNINSRAGERPLTINAKSEKELADHIGVAAAARVYSGKYQSGATDTASQGTLKGEDLNVPTAEGIGMHKFYGVIQADGTYGTGLPNADKPPIVGTRILKLVKSLDPEAAKIEPWGGPKNLRDIDTITELEHWKGSGYPSIRLTPRLREALLGGQLLFAIGGKPQQETPALQTEAEHLTTDVAAFEQRLWDEGKTAEEIAASLFDRYGFEVSPADLVLGQVWWRLTQGRGRREPLLEELLTEDRESLLRQYLAEGDEASLQQPTDPQAAPEAPQTLTQAQTPQAFPVARRNLNAVQREQVGALWSQGHSQVEIARHLSAESGKYVRLTSVSDALASLGILDRGKRVTPKQPRQVVWSAEANALLLSEDASGLSAAHLASRVSELVDQRVTAKAVYRQRAKLRAKGAEIAPVSPSQKAAAMTAGKFQWTDAAISVLTSKEIDGLTASQIGQLLNARFGGPALSSGAVRQQKSRLVTKTFNAAIGGPSDPEAWLTSFKETQDARPRSDEQLRGETDPRSGETGDGAPGTGAAPLPGEADHRYRGRVGQPGRFSVPGGTGRGAVPLTGAVFRGRSVAGLGENWYFAYAKEDPAFPSSKPTPDRQLKIVKGLGNWTTKAHLIERTPGNWELIGIATRRNRRRRGLAVRTWDAVEADLGVKLTPPGRLTRDLYRFLEKRNPALVASYQRLSNGLYYSPRQLVRLLTIHQEIANQSSEGASPQLKREIVQAQKGVAEISAVLDSLPAGTEMFDAAAFALGGTSEFNAAIGARPPLQMGSATAQGLEAPAQSLTDLVGEVTDALGLTSRIDRLSPGLKMQAAQQGGTLMGQFGTVTGVVRTKLPNDLQTLGHEGGHALEVRPSLKADLDALKRSHANELTASIPDLSEGFAEFFRTYVTNPAQAQQDAPKFFADFEDLLDAKEPAMLEALENVQAGVAELANASPFGIVRSREQSSVKPGTWASLKRQIADKGWGNTISDKLYGFYTAYVDSRHPMKRAVRYLLQTASANLNLTLTGKERLALKAIDDPYKLWRLSEHSKVWATADLQNGIRQKGDDLPSGPSFRDALRHAFGGGSKNAWNADAAEAFSSYLRTRRMLAEFARHDAGERETLPDVMIERSVWEKARNDAEAAYPQFVAAADLLYQFNQNLLKLKLDNGFLTPELYADLSQRVDYVPLNRVMDDGGPSQLTSARGQNKSKMIRQQKNSSRDFVNALELIAQDVYATRARIALNDTIRAMDRLARAAGPGGGKIAERIPAKDMTSVKADIREVLRAAAKAQGLTGTAEMDGIIDAVDDLFDQNAAATIFRPTDTNERGEPIVYLWEEGQRVPMRLGDDRIGRDIFEAFTAFGTDNADFLMDTWALGARGFRFGVTKAPAYVGVNFLRDQLATWALSTDYTPFVTGAKGLAQIGSGTNAMQRYNAFAGMAGVESDLINRAANERDALTLRRKGFAAAPTTFGSLLRTMEVTELASRLGHYDAAYKRALADGFTPEEAATEAAYAAHDVLDFSRRGSKMLQVARLIPFLNSTTQGLDAARRTMSGERDTLHSYRDLASPYLKAANGHPLSVAEKEALPNSARIWVKLGVIGMIGAALAAYYRDDDEYEEFNDYMRATHWFFKINGVWWRMPKPFELAILSNAFEAAYARLWKNDERALTSFLESMRHTMTLPSDIAGLKALGQIIELPQTLWGKLVTKDPYHKTSGDSAVPSHMRGLPPELQFTAYTSELGRLIGATLNWSPAEVDRFMTNTFATLGRDALALSDQVLPYLNKQLGGNLPGVSKTPRADKSLEDYWIVSRFTRREARASLSGQEYWKQMSRDGGTYVQAAGGYKYYLDQGKFNPIMNREAREYLDTLPPEQKAYAVLEGNYKEGEQDLHPLNRARQVMSVSSGLRKDMVMGRLVKQQSVKRGATPEMIVTSPAKQKIVNETLEDISMREARNALIVIGHPGWQHKNLTPVDGLVAELAAVSPEIAAEFAYRQANGKNKVYSFAAVQELWPQAKERLLKDGEDARLTDLKVKAKALSRFKHPATGGVRLFPDAPPPGMMRLGGPTHEPPAETVTEDLSNIIDYPPPFVGPGPDEGNSQNLPTGPLPPRSMQQEYR